MEAKQDGEVEIKTEKEQHQDEEETAQVSSISPSPQKVKQEPSSAKQRSPLLFIKRRITSKSGSKKRRDSGHSDGDYESAGPTDDDSKISEYTGNRSLSLDSPQPLPVREKPRRGIAKVFHDLKNRSKVRKSHSAPTASGESSVTVPSIAIMDDDSFSSYATPMEAHSSGYSTPMFESNLASPESSLTESFVEEDESEKTMETPQSAHINNNNSSPAQVSTSVVGGETPQELVETLSAKETPSQKPDCCQPSDEVIVRVEKASASTPVEDSTTGFAGLKSKSLSLSQHRASVPCSIKELQERTAHTGEIRFCFSEYRPDLQDVGELSPSRGFIRSLPADSSSKMDSTPSGDAANGFPKNEHLYKVLVIGELGTGKTSIIKRYVHQFFSQHYRATIGVDFALKVVHWDQNTVIRLQLWDIAGQERFGNMTRVYYKEAVGAFIVFDVTRNSTFESVAKWKQDLDAKVQLPDGCPIPCVLLANKCDQPKEGIAANASKMDEYCKEKGFAGWFETSAKDNINIDDAAKFLVGTILQNDQWSTSVKEEDPDKLDLNGKGGPVGGAAGEKKRGCC